MPAAKISPGPCSPLRSPKGEVRPPSSPAPSLVRSATPSPLAKTVYERMVHAQQHNEQWLKEFAVGNRVGWYRFRSDLGNGNFSQVKLACHQITKERVAVKILDKTKLDQKTQRMLVREIAIMETLQHPHIIRLYEVVETLTKTHLVMEYAHGGELFAKISSEGKLQEPEAKHVFGQVLGAVHYMHGRNVIHRDLKAENVFYAGPRTVKVGDFGFSTEVSVADHLLNTFCGSPPYAAPELFKDESYIGSSVDVWALGILLYFMVSGTMPFRAQTVMSLKRLILEGDYIVPPYVSLELNELLVAILQKTPLRRLTIPQIMASEWMKDNTFPMPLEDANFLPSDDLVNMPPYEKQTRAQLLRLGISDTLLTESIPKGARSPIIGTYRIILHRLQKDAEGEKDKSSASLEYGNDKLNVALNKKGQPKFRWNGWLTRKDDVKQDQTTHTSNGIFTFSRPFNLLAGLSAKKQTVLSSAKPTRKVSFGCSNSSKLCTIL